MNNINRPHCLLFYAVAITSVLLFGTHLIGMEKTAQTSILSNQDKSYLTIFHRILNHADIPALGCATQVNKHWKNCVINLQKYVDAVPEDPKIKLFRQILKVTEAEPNEVQRARGSLSAYLSSKTKDLNKELNNLLEEDLKQPEFLLFEGQMTWCENLITTPSSNHALLEPLRLVIKKSIQENPDLGNILDKEEAR